MQDEQVPLALDSYLQSLVDRHKTPSVSYLIFNQERILHSFRSGYADVLNKTLTTEDTTYCGFSVTKTFTALAILQLAEKGMLSLDDQARDHLPDFVYDSGCTIRNLLTHSAGIPNPIPLKWVHAPEDRGSLDRDLYFKEVMERNSKVLSAPNEKFRYTNLGYFLLGQIIECRSELSYEDYIHEMIISPLGLERKDLGFELSGRKAHARGYQKRFSMLNLMLRFLMDTSRYMDKKEGLWISFHNILVNGPSYGGLIGTPRGFARYIQELMKSDGVLLSARYRDLLFTENHLNSGKATGMCMSWFKGAWENRPYVAHAGGGAGYYAEIRYYLEHGMGSVIMLNRSGVRDEHLLDKVDAHYFRDTR